ncbi:MAG: family 2 glycosyl transferase [Friedmanniella sp.]|nr:family 2 glycosyl transferase [Friedmanniella sp.]
MVVPVYNPGPYLVACVESLLGQTLPATETELIFVDDGSSDESPAYLDEVAAGHEHVTVIHQPNSGWPGQPRNVGIAAATGAYVFFCDNDDWLGPEALQRLYDFAVANASDVVIPKMAGLGRPVPHHLFLETVPRASLATAALMDSLTPHKLFRRDFLTAHQLWFPEGKRRLEDHLFVTTAYLLAENVSVYAEYTCYFHIRRTDSSNAGFRRPDWAGYFDNLSEAIEVVYAHTEPGPLRNHILRRWLQVEMVNRLSGGRRVRMDDEEGADIFAQSHRVAARYFSEDVVALLPPVSRPVARAILAGDAAVIRPLAERQYRWRLEPWLLQVGFDGDRLQLAGSTLLTDLPRTAPAVTPVPAVPGRLTTPPVESAPVEVAPVERAPVERAPVEVASVDPGSAEPDAPRPTEPLADRRFVELLDQADAGETDHWLSETLCRLDLTERSTGARWPVTARVHRSGLSASFTAELDPATVAAGGRLPDGLWDLSVQVGVLGLVDRRRLTLTEERRPGPVLPEPGTDTPTYAVYYTLKTSGLCLDMGLLKQKQLRPRPTPPPPPPAAPEPPKMPVAPPSTPRRALRRLRRMLKD